MLRYFILLTALFLIGLSAKSAPTPADAQYFTGLNMLVNPSFEEGRGGWTVANGTVQIISNDVFDLNRAMEVTLAAENLDVRQIFPIPSGLVGREVFGSVAVKSSATISLCPVVDSVEGTCNVYEGTGDWGILNIRFENLGAVNEVLIKGTSITGSVKIDKVIVSSSASGGGSGGGLPPGGDAGSTIVKLSSVDGDAEWDQLSFSGFSARFNESFSSDDLRDTLEKILDLSYLPPLVTLSGSSNILREKGDTVSSITLSANVTKRSDDIARIQFFQGVSSIQDEAPPANTGTGITTAPYAVPFSDNISFTVQVTDDGTNGGPTVVTSNTLTYSFVYPYYFGAGAVGLSAAAVAGLSKNIINSTASLNRSFTTTAGQVYYFAYPASYGVLTSILDENGFEVIGDWTLRVENITGLDLSPVSYNIYEFNNPVTAGTTDFTFSR